jgi:type I restriction enzyme S subunit
MSEPLRNGVYKPKEFHGRGVKIVNMGELFAHDFLSDQEMKRLDLTAKELSKSQVLPGDLLHARRSLVLEGAGRCCLVVGASEPTTFESSLIRVRLDQNRADPRFYFYYFRSHQGRAGLASIASQTAVSGVTGSALGQLVVPLPPLATQRRIASILYAYDELIEFYTRRIAILEEMARRIYEEWFVRFRFPGHENVRMVESELGLVPEGWTIEAVEDVFETLGGGTPSKAEPSFWAEGAINWYAPTDLTGARTVFMEESAARINALGLSKSSAKLFPANSVMMTSRATIGAIAVNTTDACTNQGFITCLPSERFPLWLLFHWLKANVSMFESLGTGATFKEITKGVFRRIELAVPKRNVADDFEEAVGPMMNLVLRLERKNRNLRTTRDLLLPKLISGELDVSSMPEPGAVAA